MNIAVTGSIGSGKSLVAKQLVSLLGAVHCDTDEICRQLMQKGEAGWEKSIEKWGRRFLDRDGSIDRKALRRAVFNDEKVRRDLEAILHPLARQHVERLKSTVVREQKDLVVEVPLLFETGWQDDFDRVITVAADPETCLHRVMKRDDVDMEQALKALAAQMSIEEKKGAPIMLLTIQGLLMKQLPGSRLFPLKSRQKTADEESVFFLKNS